MDILSPHTTITVPSNYNNRFSGIAFDGCFFYLTAPQGCSIYQLNRDFTLIDSLETVKPYNCICYDNSEHCFWVTADKHRDIIYKLDSNLKEIGVIRVRSCQKVRSQIVGISYNCEKDTLLIAYCDHIAEVSKESGCACMIQRARAGFYLGILSIAPYYVVIRQDEKGQEFQLFTCDGCHFKSFRIPAFYCVNDVLFYPCGERGQDELQFVLLATKHNRYPKVLFCGVSACEMVLCCCNDEVCRTDCGKDEKEQCACDLIESIALVETSLAHILNAEGEKLQKAIELANSIDELLSINRSVTRTIFDITKLEHVLHAKLAALNDLSW